MGRAKSIFFDRNLLRKRADKTFNPRPKLNEEKVFVLLNSGDFKNRIKQLRGKYHIPKLNPAMDLVDGEISDGGKSVSVSESDFLEKLPKSKLNDFRNDVENLLDNLQIQKNFYDWVEYLILYRRSPGWIPRYNWALAFDFIHNPKKVANFGLSTAEKKWIKSNLRKDLEIKSGRPKKEAAEVYQYALKILSGSKNKQRGFQNLKLARAVEKLGNRPTEADLTKIAEKFYGSFDQDRDCKREIRALNNLRKTRQRFNKRKVRK